MSALATRDTYGKPVEPGWTSADCMNVYEFTYEHQVPVRIPDGAGDSEFSHMETMQSIYHVAAREPSFAEAAFVRHHPPHTCKRLSGPKAVLVIDAYVDVDKCWKPNA